MKRWDLNLFEHLSGTWGYGGMAGDESDVRLFIGVTPFQETSGAQYDHDTDVVKAFCHIFVERMPTSALPELLESIKRIFDFYQEISPAPQLPSARRQIRPKVGGRFERPKLSQAE